MGVMAKKLFKLEPKWKLLSALYFFITAITVFAHHMHNADSQWGFHKLKVIHESILTGTHDALHRYIYRIFIPYLAQSIINLFSLFDVEIFSAGYSIINFSCIFLTAILFHIFLRKWFTTKEAMIGVFLLYMSLPITYYSAFRFSDIPNLSIYMLGIMAIREKKDYFLIPILIFGALIRELSVFLIFIYLFYRFNSEAKNKTILKALLFFSIFILTYLILVYRVGYNEAYFIKFYEVDVLAKKAISLNLSSGIYLLLPFISLHIMWVLAFNKLKQKPLFIRRSIYISILYLFICLAIGRTLEFTGMFLPFFLIVIPSALYSLFDKPAIKD